MRKCMNMWHGKEKHLWTPLIIAFIICGIIWEIDRKSYYKEWF